MLVPQRDIKQRLISNGYESTSAFAADVNQLFKTANTEPGWKTWIGERQVEFKVSDAVSLAETVFVYIYTTVFLTSALLRNKHTILKGVGGTVSHSLELF